MVHDTELHDLNGLDLGRVLQSRKSCADIAYNIGNEMRKAVVKNTVLKQSKMSVTIDESATTDGKTVLAICLRTAAGESRYPQSFYFDSQHAKCVANTKAICSFKLLTEIWFFREVGVPKRKLDVICI
jgi:hypothetical protein